MTQRSITKCSFVVPQKPESAGNCLCHKHQKRLNMAEQFYPDQQQALSLGSSLVAEKMAPADLNARSFRPWVLSA